MTSTEAIGYVVGIYEKLFSMVQGIQKNSSMDDVFHAQEASKEFKKVTDLLQLTVLS